MIRWIALLCFIASPALAEFEQDAFPKLGYVENVASDDRLNIRIAPDHTSEILGALAPNAAGIEVVAEDETGKWGLINSDEASGWVRLSYLATPEQPRWHSFVTPLTCFGTEPFWSLEVAQSAQTVTFEDYDPPSETYDVAWSSEIVARPGGTIGLGGGTVENGFSAVIENEMCNDGMSDREYALRIRLFMHLEGATGGYDGCCSMSP